MLRAPKQLPKFAMMLQDIGTSPRAVALHLGVAECTVLKWVAKERAPRQAKLALFWETSWGRSLYESTIDNGRRYHFAHVASLEREIARLQAQIARTCKLSDTANEPVFRQA